MTRHNPNNIIGGTSIDLIPSHMGWKARQSAAKTRIAEREAASAGILLRHHIIHVSRATMAVDEAVERRDALLSRVQTSKDKIEVLTRRLMQTGVVPAELQSLKFAVDQAGALIEAADHAIVAARADLDGARDRHDMAMAEASAPGGAFPVMPSPATKKTARP